MIKNVMAAASCAVALLGCEQIDPNLPPDLRPGEETCARCRMLITEERFAAAAVDAEGEARKFDDIGCLLLERAEVGNLAARYWTKGYRSSQWLDAKATTQGPERGVSEAVPPPPEEKAGMAAVVCRVPRDASQ